MDGDRREKGLGGSIILELNGRHSLNLKLSWKMLTENYENLERTGSSGDKQSGDQTLSIEEMTDFVKRVRRESLENRSLESRPLESRKLILWQLHNPN